MATIIKILTLIILSPCINSLDKCNICKTYYRSGAYWSNNITLTNDNKFSESWSTCTYNYVYTGTWNLNGDTLALTQLEKFDKWENKTEKIKDVEIQKYVFDKLELIKLESINGKLSLSNIRYSAEIKNEIIYKD